MKGIDIIVPVHKYNAEIAGLLTRCLGSLKEMAIVNQQENIKTNIQVVGPKELPSEDISNLIEWGNEINKFDIAINDGETDFCSQVNFAVNNLCEYDYFMIVELDDMVTSKWVKMAVPYINHRKKCPIFMPLVEVYDINKPNTPIHYINEIGWSSSFTENELGSLNVDVLQDYCNFNLTGAIIKKSDFIKAGGFKPSIKVSFGYELLLRLTNSFNESYVIPKVGYFHFINREDSLTSEYHKEMSPEEGSWWIKLATEEYTYKKDRNKIYNPDNK